jgi:hypothetical protein
VSIGQDRNGVVNIFIGLALLCHERCQVLLAADDLANEHTQWH